MDCLKASRQVTGLGTASASQAKFVSNVREWGGPAVLQRCQRADFALASMLRITRHRIKGVYACGRNKRLLVQCLVCRSSLMEMESTSSTRLATEQVPGVV